MRKRKIITVFYKDLIVEIEWFCKETLKDVSPRKTVAKQLLLTIETQNFEKNSRSVCRNLTEGFWWLLKKHFVT